MNFANLLSFANQNVGSSNKNDKYFKSKLAPPKKEAKDKKLSANIKKFLQKKEQEELETRLRKAEEREALMAKRDVKQKNKINKMLKVIKSANKSVLADARDDLNTAVTLQGPSQPDEDDYGYVSLESNALYSKIMEKYTDSNETQGPIRKSGNILDKKTLREKLERAKRDMDDTNTKEFRKPRMSKAAPKDNNRLYDTNNEAGTSTETAKPVKKVFKPAPVMSFNDILKLAEKKQHEEIVVPVKVKQEPERLMTKKEKQEEEERLAALKRKNTKKDRSKEASDASPAKSQAQTTEKKQQPSKLFAALTENKPAKVSNSIAKSDHPVKVKNVPTSALKTQPIPVSKQINVKDTALKKPQVAQPQREYVPEKRSMAQYNKTTQRDDRMSKQVKRQILESDEDEYDSDDSFIDDGDQNPDVSSYIKQIFGYDKNRYRDEDFDDREMESSYAQQMREEQISKKIGIMEDLEDMRQEELDKKRKANNKKRKL